MKRLAFIPQLDSFRFIAVFAVMISHWVPALHMLPLGGLGVTFFFVLSGYLISSNLLYMKQSIDKNELRRSNAFRIFYCRRTLRIFPLYYLAILLIYLLNQDIFLGKIWWYISYLPNFLLVKERHWPGMLSHFWSLGVEEQFYLIWPLLIFFVRWNWIKFLLPGVIALTILSNMIIYFSHASYFYYFLPWNNFDAFGMGALLAYLPFSPNRQTLYINRIPFITGVLLCSALLIVVYIYEIQFLFGIAVSGIAFFMIRQAQVGFTGLFGRFLDLAVIQYLGRISYGLYVYHNFMPWLWKCLKGRETRFPISLNLRPLPWSWLNHGIVNLTAQFILLVLIASLSWFLIEKPINNLKKGFKFKPKPSLSS